MWILSNLSKSIDALNRFLGKCACVAIFLATIISAFNAIYRHLFHNSSNAFLEIQWYLFACVFLLASGYTYLENKHVRIDIFSNHLNPRQKTYLEIFGIIFFLFPAFLVLFYFTIPPAIESWSGWEVSPNPGGLPRAPIKALIPIGIAFLLLQGVSELCKSILFLKTDKPAKRSITHD